MKDKSFLQLENIFFKKTDQEIVEDYQSVIVKNTVFLSFFLKM